MDAFSIKGGASLKGDIVPQGAKNEALQILCATLLTAEPVTISNLPDIRDVNFLIEIIGDFGVKVQRLSPDTVRFQADDVNIDYLQTQVFTDKGRKLRG